MTLYLVTIRPPDEDDDDPDQHWFAGLRAARQFVASTEGADAAIFVVPVPRTKRAMLEAFNAGWPDCGLEPVSFVEAVK